MKSMAFSARAKSVVLPVFIMLCAFRPASAQVAGDTEDINHDMTFSTCEPSVTLDESPSKGEGPRLEFSIPLAITNQPSFDGFADELIAEIVVAALQQAGIPIDPDDLAEILDFIDGGIFSFVTVNGTFSAGVNGEFGGYFQVNEVGTAAIDVSYPIDVTITYPAENTFSCNDTIEIGTDLNIHTDTYMGVVPPYYDLELGPFIDFGNLSFFVTLGIDLSICVGLPVCTPAGCVCFGAPITLNEEVTISLPPLSPTDIAIDIPLLQVCEDVFEAEPPPDDFTLLACGIDDNMFSEAREIVDACGAPCADIALATFTQDPRPEMGIALPPPGFPGPTIPEMSGTFLKPAGCGEVCGTTIEEANCDTTFEALADGRLEVQGRRDETVNLEFDLVSLLEYAGITTGICIGPIGNVDFGDISPTLHIDRILDYTLTPDIEVTLDLGDAMDWAVPSEGTSGSGQFVTLKVGNIVEVTYPAYSDPVTVASEYSMDAEFATVSGHEYFKSITVRALEITILDMVLPPAIEFSTGKTFLDPDGSNVNGPNPHYVEGSPDTPSVITLDDFNMPGPELDPFVVNPEDPKLDIETMAVTDVVNLGRGERALVYRLDLTNSGDVDLARMTMNLNLDDTYAPPQSLEPHDVLCLHSDALTENELYSGHCPPEGCPEIDGTCGQCATSSDCSDGARCTDCFCPPGETCPECFCVGAPPPIDLLNSAQVACGDLDSVSCARGANPDGTIEVLVRVKPEISPILANDCFGPVEYDAEARGTAVSPIGTCIIDRHDQCINMKTTRPMIATEDLGASVIEGRSDFTIYGWDAVDIARAFELSRGNVGSGDTIRVNPYTAAFSADPRIIGDVHALGDMFITQSHIEIDYMQLGGERRMEDPRSSMTLTGAMNQTSSCVASLPEPSLELDPVNSNERVRIAEGGIRVLLPGDYNGITIEQDAELHLSSGIYNVETLRIIGGCADIKFDVSNGPITLNLHKWLMRSVTGLGFIVENGLTSDVEINYAGNNKQIFRGSVVQGTLFAPNASIVFDDGTRLEGACYAKRVKIGPFSSFTGHDFLKMLNINAACQPALPRGGLVIPSTAPCE